MAQRMLVRSADRIYSFDGASRTFDQADILIEGGKIVAIGTLSVEPATVDRVIDATGKIVLPGLVNTHHHFYQNVTRAVPLLNNTTGLDWLKYCYPLWAGIDPEAVYYGALVSVAELLLTGCTTAADFFYLFPRKQDFLFDEEVKAVRELGIRFHGVRGCTPALEETIPEALVELNIDPGELLEDEEEIFRACQAAIDRFHDPAPFSMVRVGVGPTFTTYDRPDFMQRMKQFARSNGVLTHTHCHPRPKERALCQSLQGIPPIAYLERVGWLDQDSWVAHASGHTAEDVAILAKTGAGVAHCPSSNLRLGYQVAPIPAMLQQGVPVGIGVDGGASNDSGDILSELRLAMLVHRIPEVHPGLTAEEWLGPEEIFRIGTVLGARVLGRDDIGSLEVGKAADLAIFDLADIGYAGIHDPLGALVFTGRQHRADTTVVNGQVVVEQGRLVSGREAEIVEGANRVARRLASLATRRTGLPYDRTLTGLSATSKNHS